VAAISHSADDESVTVRPRLRSLRRRLLRLKAEERGISLVELITAMAIMTIVISTLAGVFVSGSNAEVDLRRRFEAQSSARIALEKLRREVHNTCSVTFGSASTITLYSEDTAGGYTCSVANTWCAVGSGQRYGLYRKAGTTCDATGVRWADYVISSSVFSYTAPASGTLPKVGVDLSVDLRPTQTPRLYRLQDAIAVRNYLRS
jgi:Tfp pilus assembly protein PilW